MTTAVKTGTLTLRIKSDIDTEAPVGLQDTIEALSDIRGLLILSAYLGEAQEFVGGSNPGGARATLSAMSESFIERAERIADTFRVAQLTYHSPLEIFLDPSVVAATASSVVSGVALAAWKAVDLWEKLSRARVNHHRANAEIEAYRLIRQELQEVQVGHPGMALDPAGDFPAGISVPAQKAIQALLRADEVEVIEDRT
jgi:hypothetical protein